MCCQSSQARFVCLHLYLFSVLLTGLLPGPDQDVPFIFWSLALQSHALSHSAASPPVPAAGSLHFPNSFSFCNSVGSKRHHWGKGKEKVLFSVPAFTCLLGFRVKHISTAAAQHNGAWEAEILSAVKCSWQSTCKVRLFERLTGGADLIEFSQGPHKRHLWCKGNCCNKVQASVCK